MRLLAMTQSKISLRFGAVIIFNKVELSMTKERKFSFFHTGA